jgi:hypothetical protein
MKYARLMKEFISHIENKHIQILGLTASLAYDACEVETEMKDISLNLGSSVLTPLKYVRELLEYSPRPAEIILRYSAIKDPCIYIFI